MLRIIKQHLYSLKHPLHAALTLSFAGFGDAFLYPFLPQYGELMGIPVVWIGVLLSINRFIRIFFNPIVVKLFSVYGIKKITIAAAVLAIISTWGYGLGGGLFSLVLFRIIWGMAFSALRISALAYAIDHEFPGLSLGVGSSIQEMGPLFALLVGPLMLSHLSAEGVFWVLAFISLPSLFFAISLPELKYNRSAAVKLKWSLPSLFNSMTFFSSFLVEGVLIVVAGVLLASAIGEISSRALTSLVAGYLAYRRICSLLFSPAGGLIADRIGYILVYQFSFFLIIGGLVMLLLGWVRTGLLVVFTFSTINSTMAPIAAAGRQSDKLSAVSVNATWRDLGAALGALAGGLLVSGRLLNEIFTIVIFMMALLLLINVHKTTKK